MKKLVLGLIIFSVILLNLSNAEACVKKCDCGCNKGKQCTCYKDNKGNYFRPEIINLQENELKLQKCKCSKNCSKKCKCGCHKKEADKEIKACSLNKNNSCNNKCKKGNKLLFWKKKASKADN